MSGQAFATGLDMGKMAQSQKIHRDNLSPAPKGFKSMLKYIHWDGFLQATHKEYADLKRRGTWRTVPRPKTGPQTQILPTMWVFTYKFDPHGYLVKYKAWLVIHGDLYTSIYNDTYAATLVLRTFRSLMAIAAAHDLETMQFDAINAFMNSDLDETVYIKFPDGFGTAGMCLLLLKVLYGLKRSPLL